MRGLYAALGGAELGLRWTVWQVRAGAARGHDYGSLCRPELLREVAASQHAAADRLRRERRARDLAATLRGGGGFQLDGVLKRKLAATSSPCSLAIDYGCLGAAGGAKSRVRRDDDRPDGGHDQDWHRQAAGAGGRVRRHDSLGGARQAKREQGARQGGRRPRLRHGRLRPLPPVAASTAARARA